MAKQIINIGSGELTGDGESLRSAFDKINDNFGELYLKDTSDFDGEFSSLAGTPTTLGGYGITDAATSAQGALAATAVQPQTSLSGYGITDALELGTSSTTALAGDTALFSGDYDDLSNKPTLLQIGTSSTTALAGDTALFSGDFADITNKPTTLAGYGITDGGGSGLQSRLIRTNQTSSLADGAEEDLDITGFKAYALMAITTDKAARVRLYVKGATRTADASRAEGVDPTSDAGLIAEVITTGAETVIISPGAYGFNLESSTTTNIPCRVTNKSGSTDTVQVSLLILQMEA